MNLLRAVGLIVLATSAGCVGGSRTIQHEIQYESTLNTVTEVAQVDYVPELIAGRPTAPVLRALDPTGIKLNRDYTRFNLLELIVSDGELAIVEDSVVSVFVLPAPGETLTLRQKADSAIVPLISGFLAGEVQNESIAVDVPRERSIFQEIRLTIKWLLVLAGVGILGWLIYLFVQQRRAKMLIRGTADVASRTLESLMGRLNRK